MCGMDFIKYQAVSYKVRVAGQEGIFYYVKVVFHFDVLFFFQIKKRKEKTTSIEIRDYISLFSLQVNVWQNYCLHLRIFTHKNELKVIPSLQAILERAQPDNGNIEFF